jgi:hypothetical protein
MHERYLSICQDIVVVRNTQIDPYDLANAHTSLTRMMKTDQIGNLKDRELHCLHEAPLDATVLNKIIRLHKVLCSVSIATKGYKLATMVRSV